MNDEKLTQFVNSASNFFENEMPEMRRKVNDVHAAIYGGHSGLGRPLSIRIEDLERKTSELSSQIKLNTLAVKEDIKTISDERKQELPEKILTKDRIDNIWKIIQGLVFLAVALYLGLK